jgi:hypothetical protein
MYISPHPSYINCYFSAFALLLLILYIASIVYVWVGDMRLTRNNNDIRGFTSATSQIYDRLRQKQIYDRLRHL